MTDSLAASRVLVRTEGALGRLTLHRPEAINALDVGMIEILTDTLNVWRDDSDVQIVLLDGAGNRGMCAGGDVRALHAQIVAGEAERTAEFFRAEYALNAMIAEYPKPIVAFADGITMGGGIGLAGHAAIRIVTERSKLAMPETRIGFTPDVGGTRLLAKAPGRFGEYFGLTGATMSGADAVYLGFADHFVPSDRLEALSEALAFRADPTGPSEIVLLFDETPEPTRLPESKEWVDDAFSAPTVSEIIERLHAQGTTEAAAVADLLEGLAPTGLTVTLDAVREARDLPSLRAALEGEYRRVMWFVNEHPDLVEGIRAQLVDKDRNPRWDPPTLAELAPDAGAPARAYVPQPPLF
ncbi:MULTISPECIES: enoyl-CoA hydratase/isomerase family protein [unclassified Microbacterium]|uniref:enoyl-CoA hydratase/isomerase family protein n=1 Tax=unclassified Microbacterium TaxID=2609290 RepID=UPI001604CD6E|nr:MULTISPECIES: enoyl-CoA hydratase/isomerase family protein [unclassified Microbacterium]QNA93758.1 enoyl-CoA hydratase/isomerase family protein [Microbacterium sp. Se63.02b]QYM64050.1 enoyl-CoA hydratase/isomerase family protein [Microbacterium sp. Se5.02b]